MRVLVEQHSPADLDALAEAWDRSETFVLLPSKCPFNAQEILALLAGLPADLRTGRFVLLSSGSTGKPKLIIGDRARAESLASVLHRVQDLEPVRSTLGLLPLSYCFSFVNQWLWARTHARQYVATSGFARPDELERLLQEASDAMVCLVGAQVPLLLRQFAGKAFDGVTRLLFAGGRFPQERLADIARCFPNALAFNNYGCVEAMPRLTIRRGDEGTASADVGRPIPGVELSCEPDGAIRFRSAYRAVGWVDESGFHRVDDDDWVDSGDVGHVDDRGHWWVTGRRGEVFKRYGEKVSPPLLVESLRREWRGSVATYREREASGEEAFVLVLSPEPAREELQSILRVLRRDFSRAHWPLRIESTTELPALPSGKTDLTALPRAGQRKIEWRQIG